MKDKPMVLMKNEIKSIFDGLEKQDSKDIFFTLHYSTKPLRDVKEELKEKSRNIVNKTLYQQLTMLLDGLYEKYESTQPNFQIGVQINVSWPNPEDINNLRVRYPKLKTILQVSDFSSLEERIGKYDVDYTLIDTSRGKGIEFEMDGAIKVYETIKRHNPAMIGFAGGFSPENVRKRVRSLIERLGAKDFCIDAQGKLRSGEYLDMIKVERYLKEAIEAFEA